MAGPCASRVEDCGDEVPVMSELVRFAGLERSYGARDVFSGLDGVIADGERIALVGPNGAGKSTLVRTLAGTDEPDAGTIARTRGMRLGYLAQDAAEGGPQTLRAAFDGALEAGHAMEWEIRSTLNRFDFTDADWDRSLTEFSGGERTRALLARTLLEKPDWLILDEPTNHLDVETVRFLEDLIANDGRAFLVVSHDRYFIERIANRIWELDRGKLETYTVKTGRAYTDFLEQRAQREADRLRRYEAAQAERKRQRAVIDELKTHGSHNYSHVRSREKAFDRVVDEPAPDAPRRSISVGLKSARRATNGFAIEVNGVAKSYDRELFSGVTVSFTRGDRVAIVGPNGAGKSTFLSILAGQLDPDRGSVRYGTGLTTGYYSQSSVDDLPAGALASEAVMAMGVTDEVARGLLGRLGLGGDSGDKPVEAFSGGERRRIMLARLMARRADCLFLDEPTNDLDIPSREALEDVLAEYEGALFIVSHDRFLLKRLGDRVVAIDGGKLEVIPGDYEAYERARHAASPAANGARSKREVPAKTNKADAHESRQDEFRRKRELAAAEKAVADLETARMDLEAQFAAPDVYDDPASVVNLQRAIEQNRKDSEAAMERWERAMAAAEPVATSV